METSEKTIGQTRKLRGRVISTYTKGGVAVFRLVKRRRGKILIGERFNMRVYKGGKRVYFPLSAALTDAKREADAISRFLEGHTLDEAAAAFRAS